MDLLRNWLGFTNTKTDNLPLVEPVMYYKSACHSDNKGIYRSLMPCCEVAVKANWSSCTISFHKMYYKSAGAALQMRSATQPNCVTKFLTPGEKGASIKQTQQNNFFPWVETEGKTHKGQGRSQRYLWISPIFSIASVYITRSASS